MKLEKNGYQKSKVAFLAVIVCLCLPLTAFGLLSVTIDEIGPKQSSLDPSDPDGASGGRVNGLATIAGNNRIFYAASEWGGLFKSTDAGRTWEHLDGHVPTVTWDVEVDPTNPNRVYASSFYDGRLNSVAGINVSSDGGVTWTKPATASPPVGFCVDASRRSEPSAFGIAIDPDTPSNAYIGTNCGLAISNDSGANWTFVDPTPADDADNIWDVVVHDQGVIDICGDDGHLRSTDGAATWSTATGVNPLPGGRCSIAVSPDESYVLFAVVGTTIFESDDSGASWPIQYVNPSRQGRIPFVETNIRDDNSFDLWFGDVRLHRASCTTPTPAAPGGSRRCSNSNSWAGPFTRSAGGHDDTGAIVFDSEAGDNACPVLFSSDGGVYFNTIATNPQCHSPKWEQPNITPQAVWNFDMAGAQQAGAVSENLYFGNQDTGTFGSTDAGAANPSWNNQRCCDGFDVAADSNRVLSTVCCFGGGGRSTRLFISNPGMVGGSELNNYPPGNLRSFQQLDSIVNFGPDDYVVITNQGVFITTDITVVPIIWSELGATSTPPNACGVQVAQSGGTITFFVKSGGCNGVRGGTLWQHNGTAPGGTWQQVTRSGAGRFGVYAVDPNNPDRIIASDLGGTSGPEMVFTNDVGATWSAIPQLDNLMTGGGIFKYQTTRGPTRFTGFGGYPQPTLVAFDPFDSNIVIAAGADSGVFISVDNGASWELVTDPINPGVSGTPHIPRARYAHFDHDEPNLVKVYLGTQGRGQWRIAFSEKPPIDVRAFQYAVKFICGKSAGDVVAPGTYFTAINVHNPSYKDIRFRKKVAIALPGEKAGHVSKFFDAKLGPDQAMEIDCPDILKHAEISADFLKGFVVIESDVDLDVVAVYSAAGREGMIETFDIERTLSRRRKVQLPDLEPAPDPRPGVKFCKLVETGLDKGKLVITVHNRGNADAPASTTTIHFSPGGTINIPTPAIPAGASVDLSPLKIPGACFNPDCDFKITVDSNGQVTESDEGNNIANGMCLG
jgi:hypothetical protein